MSAVLMIGAFDTKGPEYAYLREQILRGGAEVVSANTGVLGSTDRFPVDIESGGVCDAAGVDLQRLRDENDRGRAMSVMADGAARIAKQLYDSGRIDSVIGLGGSGGTTVITAAMRALPIGMPKVCVSTVAASDTGMYVGSKDVTIVPSITDVAGVNRISRKIFAQAAGALLGMRRVTVESSDEDRPIIVASMFGNTTECVTQCRELLEGRGYEVLVFHATGAGGRTMESLIDEGLVDACLDITTTEWADELCGGIFSAGPRRLEAAGRRGIPHLIVPGCVDMVNFGPLDSVPAAYRDAGRLLYQWNPAVTLMRTNVDENRQIGETFAAKANLAGGPVAFLLPTRGVSILDGDGERFCDREADQACFQAIKSRCKPGIPIEEVDANINDQAFAARAVEMLLEQLEQFYQPS